MYDSTFERYALPYKQAFERIGIIHRASWTRLSFQNRLRSFDFEMTTAVWGQSLSPGNEQRDFWDLRPPTAPVRETSPASGPRDRRADREGDLREGPHELVDDEPSIERFSPTITSCRSGARA